MCVVGGGSQEDISRATSLMLRTLSQVSRRDADSHTKRVPDLPIRTRVPVRACAKARESIPLHQIAHTRAALPCVH